MEFTAAKPYSSCQIEILEQVCSLVITWVLVCRLFYWQLVTQTRQSIVAKIVINDHWSRLISNNFNSILVCVANTVQNACRELLRRSPYSGHDCFNLCCIATYAILYDAIVDHTILKNHLLFSICDLILVFFWTLSFETVWTSLFCFETLK